MSLAAESKQFYRDSPGVNAKTPDPCGPEAAPVGQGIARNSSGVMLR